MIGRTLAHYTIESRLGKGGMGEVYHARDAKLGRAVAIKVLPETLAANDESVRRFITEARAASSLNHPNIVTVHDIDQDGSTHYIVMERIDGEPLSALLGAPLTIERFLDVALQVTSAVAAAHEAGIVHRDLKPANVMITRTGIAKVVDFGLARLLPSESSTAGEDPTVEWTHSQTRPGTVLGTVGYMAPEQVQGERATARSDVFSLGVLFYEVLSGRSAFRSSTPISTFAAILRDTPPPLATLRNDVPPQLQRVLDRCLAKDAAERYASASELHRDLLALRDSLRVAPIVSRSRAMRWALALGAVLLVVVAAFAVSRWRQERERAWARNVAPGEIERLLEADDPVGAYEIARRATRIAPDDVQVQQAWTNLAYAASITSDPADVAVEIRSYRAAEGDRWVTLGRTPLSSVDIPFPLVRFRLSKEGFVTTEVAPEFDTPELTFRLHRPDEIPEGMVAVTGGDVAFGGRTFEVPDFWIDRYEVTNAEFKKFVDEGGYRRPELWKYPFSSEKETLSWEAAMKYFIDQTGQTGPAFWELGTFPEGKGDHPVEGVSWYEAAAYAEFRGKSLPTVFHWKRAAANDGLFADVVLRSNFDGKGTVPVGSRDALGHWGTHDMAGNVKEWCNSAIDRRRYALGGGWADARYFYTEPDALDPLSRLSGTGFRLVQLSESPAPELTSDITSVRYEIEEPVGDEAFRLFASLFDYDRGALGVEIEQSDDSHDAWRRERVSFNAAYGGERIIAHLFIPRNVRPPYQAIVYFPGSDAVYMKSSRQLWLRMVEFYVRSGRVVIFPVYQGTYERQVPPPRGQNAIRELNTQRVKDIRRTVDYLESRADIDSKRIGYYGLSLGASRGAFALAVEPRFRVGVLFGTGFYPVHFTDRPPDGQPHNYLPRIKVPTLLINGRHDFTLPVETAQKPFFELIGSGNGRKKHVMFEGGHVPTQFNDAVREMLAWTDQWMGPVASR